MSFMKWNDNYSVGIEKLDEQHKSLIAMINDLNDAMMKGVGKEKVGDIVNKLVLYAKNHFADEEKLFSAYKYPAAVEHIKEHNTFTSEVAKFKEGFDSNKLFLSIEVMNFLKDWLLKHILASDKDYTKFFNEKGVK